MHASFWLGKLANLNAARTEHRGIAPHKPLVLLTVIDLIESGDIPDGWVRFDVRLVSRFRDYWELVRERQRNAPDIPMPFHALSGNDDPLNGLALTPDAHWMFDAGLWTAIPKGDHILIRVAHGRFTESSPQGRNLADLDQKPLHFHSHARLRPEPAYLVWHREKHRI